MTSYVRELVCLYCDARFPLQPMSAGCPACRTETFASGLSPTYDYERLRDDLDGGPLADPGDSIWRYRRLLPLRDPAHETSLGEGGSPLIPVPRLAQELNAEQVWIKDESHNPTWTFKDRLASVTVSVAVEFGAETLVVSTSGNFGASVAAYTARAGLGCVVLTYPGIPAATRTLIEAYGARLVVTSPEGRWQALEEGVREHGWYPASNYTDIPTNGAFGHEGYKSIAFEVMETLGFVPDVVSIPTSYGEGLFGIWKGFEELARLGRTSGVPRMLASEPTGGPLVPALARPGNPIVRVPRVRTSARGIGGVVNSYMAVAALRASKGMVAQVAEEDIVAAQRRLAAEGFFVEPASAAALAGLRSMAASGELEHGLRIVLVNTSSGLKNLEGLRTPRPAAQSGPTGSSRDTITERKRPTMCGNHDNHDATVPPAEVPTGKAEPEASGGCCDGHGKAPATSQAEDLAECPVMPGTQVVKGEAEAAGLYRDYAGERYWLCCPACGPLWDADPAKYAAV